MTEHKKIAKNQFTKSSIKIVSLDCWGTIISSNNETWDKFASQVAGYFNITKDNPTDFVKTISKQINDKLDQKSGEKIKEYPQKTRVRAIIRALGFKPDKSNVNNVIKIINQTFLDSANPVILIEPQIATTLKILKEQGYHVLLLSNSGLVTGQYMRLVLEKMNILTHFDGLFFSDEFGLPKPSPDIFEQILKYAKDNKIAISNHEIIHIGDNHLTDYLPAQKIGFTPLLISDIKPENVTNHSRSISQAIKDGWFGEIVKNKYSENLKKLGETKFENLNYISKYNLSTNKTGKLIDETDQNLDFEVYSEMKYGVKSAIKLFAYQLYELLSEKMPELIASTTPPRFIESRKTLIPASGHMSRYVRRYINQKRKENNLDPIELINATREFDNLFDYAALEPHTRKVEVFDDLIFPKINNSKSPIIVIEDICVSGNFTKKMLQSISEVTDTKPTFVYLIKVGEKIRQNHIHVEPIINSRFIKGLPDIEPFIKRGDFLLTRKYYKMLLSSEINILENHIKSIPEVVLKEIVHNLKLSKSDIYEKFYKNYDFIVQYQSNG